MASYSEKHQPADASPSIDEDPLKSPDVEKLGVRFGSCWTRSGVLVHHFSMKTMSTTGATVACTLIVSTYFLEMLP